LCKNLNDGKIVEEIMNSLSKDSLQSIRQIICSKGDCPIHILENFLNEKNEYMKELLAKNKNASSYILEEISKNSKNVLTLTNVAENYNTNFHTLNNLYNDKRFIVMNGAGYKYSVLARAVFYNKKNILRSTNISTSFFYILI
jgi:hypothetical protein